MSIQLILRPSQEPLSWEDFCAQTSPHAIALDGYVSDGPRLDEKAPRLNLNHHENVERLATRATCAQALIALRFGLFKLFCNERGPRADIYANDCDEDVCTAWFVLNNAHLTVQTGNPMVNRLVGLVDALDSTAGAYPFQPDMPGLQELAWIFQPYRRFRAGGGLDKRNADDFRGIITDVESRMLQYITGRGDKIALDYRYEKIGDNMGWSMIREIGDHGRTGAFNDGVTAYVIARERADGRMSYTVGRISQFIPFDVLGILAALNEAEADPAHRWGGGNTIGGSPRATGSKLSPEEVARIVNSVPPPFGRPR